LRIQPLQGSANSGMSQENVALFSIFLGLALVIVAALVLAAFLI
jgi:hypothetical protein